MKSTWDPSHVSDLGEFRCYTEMWRTEQSKGLEEKIMTLYYLASAFKAPSGHP